MQSRKLGTTGIDVSVLGLGTVKLGRSENVRYPEPFEIPDDTAARELLAVAKSLGINLLDTAPAYGTSEERLGKLLMGQRHDWVICTKVGEIFSDGASTYDFTPEHVQHSVKRSLQRIHTDYLDVVLIHSDGRDLSILESCGTLEALNDLKSQGWIRAVGISHKSVTGAERAIDLGCDVIMATLNLAAQEESVVIADAGAAGCGVLVKKAFASGHGSIDSLRFAVGHAGVSAVVVGTINPEHLRDNAAALAAG
jgi:aryl-alcohol dehydrogenase-like predicted oxidoreductase